MHRSTLWLAAAALAACHRSAVSLDGAFHCSSLAAKPSRSARWDLAI
jgi:hypothetical protein